MVNEEKLLDSECIFNGRMINLRKDRVQLPDGKVTTREVVEHPGAVAVVAVDENGNVIMVRQYRYPIGKETLEIPAGKLDPGEDREDCARRELIEETGYQAEDLRHLLSFYTTPGFTDEIIHVYFTRVSRRKEAKTDDDEFIEVEIHSPARLLSMIAGGEIEDGKTILGVLFARQAGLI